MSSITPLSYVDDGDSLTRRLSSRLRSKSVVKWIENTSSEVSDYTGSFMDDGADMLSPADQPPGFGPIDPEFYEYEEAKKSRRVWNEDVQRAISGDVQHSLIKMRELGSLHVKKHRGDEDKVEKRKSHGVIVPRPLKWDTFIIKADDGRAIVVDEDGEFESSPRKGEKEALKRWIQVESTVSSLSSDQAPISSTSSESSSSSDTIKHHKSTSSKTKYRHQRRPHQYRKPHQKHTPSLRVLTPITDSESDVGWHFLGESVPSPTGFYMTGGASGWPKSEVVVLSTPTESDTSSLWHFVHKRPSSPPRHLNIIYEQTSPRRINDEVNKEQNPSDSITRGDSHSSYKTGKSHGSWVFDFDNHSAKRNYKAPTVEDAPNTSSEDNECSVETPRCISRHSTKNQAGGSRVTENGSWTDGRAYSTDGWGGSNRRSEVSWDGFEKIKTMSEVSVVGSGSDRTLLESQTCSQCGSTASTYQSRPNHTSQTSDGSKISQSGWSDSLESWAMSESTR